MFYTYLWLREDGTPYYVGKGTDRRAFESSGHRFNVPRELSHILVQECENEQEAFFIEKFLIDFYGRIDLGTGCLRNLTDGGEGCSGHVPSLFEREEKSRRMLEHMKDPRNREKHSRRGRGIKTHCKRGHVRSAENLSLDKGCKLCRAIRDAENIKRRRILNAACMRRLRKKAQNVVQGLSAVR